MSAAVDLESPEAPDVLVVVPARDEAESIEACLAALVVAVRGAVTSGRVRRARIAVAAHRCRDDTADRATAALRASGLEHLVLADEKSTTVGGVRTRLVDAVMSDVATSDDAPLEPSRTWVLSTDADSLVPADWVGALLDVADRTGADLVAGFVGLSGWVADPAAVAAYDHLLDAGLTAEGHDHVWAANLAVSYRAFVAAGGFPSVEHGEERVLAGRVARTGKVVGALQPVVVTSARMPGRAPHGLGDLLRRLAEDVAEAS